MKTITLYVNRDFTSKSGNVKQEERLKMDVSFSMFPRSTEPEIFSAKIESTIEGKTRLLNFAETITALTEYKNRLVEAIHQGFRHHTIDDVHVFWENSIISY